MMTMGFYVQVLNELSLLINILDPHCLELILIIFHAYFTNNGTPHPNRIEQFSSPKVSALHSENRILYHPRCRTSKCAATDLQKFNLFFWTIHMFNFCVSLAHSIRTAICLKLPTLVHMSFPIGMHHAWARIYIIYRTL